ncbi:MAG: ankyrin repeat domain-containing protein [Planctomycetia bacterium]|nr:ankyrin repeat domain-containing protein [Planctomycetia bacterium]
MKLPTRLGGRRAERHGHAGPFQGHAGPSIKGNKRGHSTFPSPPPPPKKKQNVPFFPLLAWGLSVDGGVGAGRTPLQAFAHQADHRAVAWLIAHGADVNARSSSGRTAAHFSAERNTGPKALALLVERGADLSARDEDGQTPLEIAK